MASITIFSAICHSSWRRTSDKLPVVSQASPTAVCFYSACFKLVSVFLLNLEFWLTPYLFACLLVGNIHVFSKSIIVCCHLIWLRECYKF